MSNQSSLDIDSVPKDWSIIPCGVFFKEKSIKNTEGEINLSVYRDYGVIPKDSRDDNHNRVSEDTSTYKLVEPGDFVLNKMKGWSGSLGVSDYRGIVSPSYTVLQPVKGIHNKYFHYLLRSETYRQMYESLSYGVRIGQWELRYHDFKKIPSLYPPIEEQKLISNYLDKKLKQIDLLIENIQKRKNLIKESIRAYLFEIRLKNVKLNLYPNEWFQFVPDGWEIVKFRQLFEPIKITNNPATERLLSVTQDKGVVYRDEQDRDVVNPGDDISSYKLVEPGDVIISLRSADGGLEISDIRGLVSPAYIVLKPKEVIDRNFYRFLLTSENFIVEMNRYIKGIRDGKNIYFDDIKDVLIPYLPLSKWDRKHYELVEIHQNLVSSFGIYDRKIKCLEEYKQSLISSIVVGKVRVTEEMV
jgi:type I restriction enzyme S subunit